MIPRILWQHRRRAGATAALLIALGLAACSQPNTSSSTAAATSTVSRPKGDPSFNFNPGSGVGGSTTFFFDAGGVSEQCRITLLSLPVDVTAADLAPAAGQKFVAVELSVANMAPPGTPVSIEIVKKLSLALVNGTPATPVTGGTFAAASPRLPSPVTVDGGATTSGWAVFSIASSDRAFQLNLQLGGQSQMVWSLLPTPPPGMTPPPGATPPSGAP